MTINQLASKLCKAEGKKKSVSIGNCREILGILSDIAYLDPDSFIALLLLHGRKRMYKRAAKSKKK